MTTDQNTKRRWLRSVLDAVDEPIPVRVFPRGEHSAQNRPTAKGLALRLKEVTRPMAHTGR